MSTHRQSTEHSRNPTEAEMNSIPIIRGRFSERTMLVKALLLLIFSISQLCWSIAEKRWPMSVVALMFSVMGMADLRTWLSFRRGVWRLEWEGPRFRILERGQTLFDGHLSEMHRIDQDGRGYFLRPEINTIYRISRKSIRADLEGILERHLSDPNEPTASPISPEKAER